MSQSTVIEPTAPGRSKNPALSAPASAVQVPVLIDFRHGLGDAVQLTSVLMHLKRERPDWRIDVAAGQGKHTCFGGLCERALVRDRQPIDRRAYRHVFELAWDECPTSYADCPSTKAEHCLKTVFGIEPAAELCRYEIAIGPEARAQARCYLETICGPGADRDGRYPAVLLHYQANTSIEKKNLSHETARQVCQAVIEAGFVPVILDWDRRSPLPDGVRIRCPAADAPLWGNTGTGDAEALAALIAASTLFIGVDSGPLHVAGATGTPTVGVWTGHHPLHYFGLADNVAHLVPEHHASLLRGDRSLGQAFFERHYRHQTYQHFEAALLKLVTDMLPGDEAGLVRSHQFWVRRDNVEQDLVIVRDIAEQDSYRIAELQLPGPVAVDVGAHIGVFSRAFRQRHPSARVIAVECCPENIPALERNIGDFATIVPAALTYDPDVALLNAVYPGCISTGGSTVISRAALSDLLHRHALPEDGLPRPSHSEDGLPRPSRNSPLTHSASPGGEPANDNEPETFPYWLDGRPLATITLEALMAQAGIDRIDVLKLDCEGSEFSILENTTSLDRIGVIVGECHGRERFLELVARKFAGWPLRILREGDPGTFWLTNPRASQGPGRLSGVGLPARPALSTPIDSASSPSRHLSPGGVSARTTTADDFWRRFEAILHPLDRPMPDAWRRYYTTLFEVARELQPRRVCEIGVRAGYSAFAILSAVPDAVMLGIEADLDEATHNTHGGRKGLFKHAETILAGFNYHLLLADSHQLARLPRCDLVYVDGEHTFDGCLADLRLAEQSTDSILADDYDSSPAVRTACDRFAAERPDFRVSFIDNGLTGFALFTRA